MSFNSHGCLVSVTPLLARRRGWVLGRTALNAASLLFEIVETISKPVILPSSLDAEFARCDFHRACPSGRGIPWHRVVGAGGRLLLREPNVSLQRKLLESEGLHVVQRRIENFPAWQWLPGRKKRPR